MLIRVYTIKRVESFQAEPSNCLLELVFFLFFLSVLSSFAGPTGLQTASIRNARTGSKMSTSSRLPPLARPPFSGK